MLGHSNKAHDGFLGHSYIGKWVNFGAGTTTANLKITYGEVSVQYAEREVPTGRQFFGSVIGDHVKTGIGTRLMPGTYIGFCSTLIGSTIPPRFIPSFSFWTDKGMAPYDIDKAKQVMKAGLRPPRPALDGRATTAWSPRSSTPPRRSKSSGRRSEQRARIVDSRSRR